MTQELIIAIIGLIGTLIGAGIIGTILYRRQNRKLKDIEVIKAEQEARLSEIAAEKAALDIKLAEVQVDTQRIEHYEQRIADLHLSIDKLNLTINDQSATIAKLNHTIDDKTDRIRKVEDRNAVTERENTRLAEENGELKADRARHRCVITKCGGRDPQNEHTAAALQNGTAIFPAAPAKNRKTTTK